MAFIQTIPPPIPPPPPPGLPIDAGLIVLMVVGLVYALFILNKQSAYFSPICDSKTTTQKTRNKLYKVLGMIALKK